MKVVLTQTTQGLGLLGETKDVSIGYARNFLFPKRLAMRAHDAAAKTFTKQFMKNRQTVRKQHGLITELAEGWRGKTFHLTARASEDGTLYAAVSPKDIRKLLGRDDLDIEIPTIKQVGTHKIDLRFADGATIPVTIVVEAEGRATARGHK